MKTSGGCHHILVGKIFTKVSETNHQNLVIRTNLQHFKDLSNRTSPKLLLKKATKKRIKSKGKRVSIVRSNTKSLWANKGQVKVDRCPL